MEILNRKYYSDFVLENVHCKLNIFLFGWTKCFLST